MIFNNSYKSIRFFFMGLVNFHSFKIEITDIEKKT